VCFFLKFGRFWFFRITKKKRYLVVELELKQLEKINRRRKITIRRNGQKKDK